MPFLIIYIIIDFLPALLPIVHLHVHVVLSVLPVGLGGIKLWDEKGSNLEEMHKD